MKRRGGGVWAISVDPPEFALRTSERNRLPFPILCDVERTVTSEYGLLHAGGGPSGEDIPQPASLLIGPERRVLWRYVASAVQDRPDPAAILRAIEDLLPE